MWDDFCVCVHSKGRRATKSFISSFYLGMMHVQLCSIKGESKQNVPLNLVEFPVKRRWKRWKCFEIRSPLSLSLCLSFTLTYLLTHPTHTRPSCVPFICSHFFEMQSTFDFWILVHILMKFLCILLLHCTRWTIVWYLGAFDVQVELKLKLKPEPSTPT